MEALAMFGLSTSRCDYCGNILRRARYYWQVEGRSMTTCPSGNARFERKANKAAAENGTPYRDRTGGNRYAHLSFGGIVLVGFLALQRFEHGQSSQVAPSSTPTTSSEMFLADTTYFQKAAVQKYPDLAVKGSPLNIKFLARLNDWQTNRDARLKNSDWPEVLANDCTEK